MEEIDRAGNLIRKNNRALYDFVRRKCEGQNTAGSFMSYYVFEVETRIISELIRHLWEETVLPPTLCFKPGAKCSLTYRTVLLSMS